MSTVSSTVNGGKLWEPSSDQKTPVVFNCTIAVIAVCLSFLVVMYAGNLTKAVTYNSPEEYGEKFLLPDLLVMDLFLMNPFSTVALVAIVSLVVYFLLNASDSIFGALTIIVMISLTLLAMGASINLTATATIGNEMETWLSEEHGLEYDNAYKNLFYEFQNEKTVTMEENGNPVSVNFSFDEDNKKISVKRVVP